MSRHFYQSFFTSCRRFFLQAVGYGFCLSVLFALCLRDTPLFASPTAADTISATTLDSLLREDEIAPVVVKAERMQLDVRRIPLGVSSLRIHSEGSSSSDLRSLSGALPNVYLQPSGLRISSPIYVRGVGSTMGTPPVGLYVDGIPYFDRDAFLFALDDVERVEFLRGPQTALYGRNSIIGHMNVYTALPRATGAMRAEVAYGSFNTLSAKLGGDFPIGVWRSRVLATASHTQGDHRMMHTDADVTPSSTSAVRYRGYAEVDSTLRIDLGASYTNSDDFGYGYAVIDSLMAKPFYVNYNGHPRYERSKALASLRVEKDFSPVALEFSTSYAHAWEKQRMDADYTVYDVFEHTRRVRQHTATAELLVRSRRKRQIAWLAGAFGFYRNHNQQVHAPFGKDKALLLGSAAGMVDSTDYYNHNFAAGGALFAQGVWHEPYTGLQLTVSLRGECEYTQLDYSHYHFSLLSDGKAWATQQHKKIYPAVLPRVGLLRVWLDRLTTYVSVARGFKAGGYNVLSNEPIERSAHLDYDAEQLWCYEAGVKWIDPETMLTASVAGSFIDWKNQQIFIIEMMGPAIRNAGRVHSWAVEGEFSWIPLSWLSVSAGGGYNHARYVEHTRRRVVGKQSIFAPNFTAFSRVAGRWQVGRERNVHSAASVAYNAFGRQYFDELNTIGYPYHGVLKASLSVEKGGVYVRGWADNILDERYMDYMFYSPIGKKMPEYLYMGQLGMPFSCGVALGVKM